MLHTFIPYNSGALEQMDFNDLTQFKGIPQINGNFWEICEDQHGNAKGKLKESSPHDVIGCCLDPPEEQPLLDQVGNKL
jgi:hypothetical protein